MKRAGGFTIVELLIVIVVIGILAAIVIIAFNGIQIRAYEAKALSIVNAYEKGLKMYKAEKGRYPSYTNDNMSNVWVCLGSADQYPARDGFAAGQCETWSGPTVVTDEGFVNELRTVMGPPVSGELPVIDYGSGRARGVMYHAAGQSIDYYMKGTGACPRGVKTIDNGNTRCVIHIDTAD